MTDLSPRAKKIGAASLVLVVLIPFAFDIPNIYVDPSDPGFGARDVPRLVVWLGLALCGMMILSAVRAEDDHKQQIQAQLGSLIEPLALVGAAFGYIWAVTAFQYALPTFALLALLSWYFGCRSFRDVVMLPAIAVAVYYALFFVLLGIYEAPGTVLSYDSYGFFRVVRQAIGLQ